MTPCTRNVTNLRQGIGPERQCGKTYPLRANHGDVIGNEKTYGRMTWEKKEPGEDEEKPRKWWVEMKDELNMLNKNMDSIL